MADSIWPETLPQRPSQSGFQETLPANSVRTQMDVGPAKMRRRSTSAPTILACTFELTQAQTVILDTFFKTTLVDGSLPFDWAHPRTGVAGEWRFTEPPQHSAAGGDMWDTSVKLEKLP